MVAQTCLSGGAHIIGATTANLTINDRETNDSGNYQVIVTNYAGSVTSIPVALLTVTNNPPTITQQPTSQTVGVGSNRRCPFNGSRAVRRLTFTNG